MIKINIYRNSKLALLTGLIIISVFACSQEQEKNQKLFYGGTILTVDETFSEVEALVIEDQKIVASGSFDDLNKKYGKSANLIDLEVCQNKLFIGFNFL